MDQTSPPGDWGLPWQTPPKEPAPRVSDKITLANSAAQADVLADVVTERARQDSELGPMDQKAPLEVSELLSQEFTDYCQAEYWGPIFGLSQKRLAAMRKEAIRLAAAAVALVESIDQHKGKESP